MVSQDGLYEFYSTILELYLEADARDRVTAALFLFQDVEEEEERFGKEALEAMVSFFFFYKEIFQMSFSKSLLLRKKTTRR